MTRLASGICAIATALGVLSVPAFAQQPAGRDPVGSATPRATAAVAGPRTPSRTITPTVLPGTPASAFTTIQGNALDSGNRALTERHVRLRDARIGRIVDRQLTDKAGLFTFRAVDPGSYVVELVDGRNSAVLAASDVLNVNAGESVTTIVRLPRRIPPLGGVFGHGTAQAAAITAAAAASGVLTQGPTTDVSCEQLPCNR